MYLWKLFTINVLLPYVEAVLNKQNKPTGSHIRFCTVHSLHMLVTILFTKANRIYYSPLEKFINDFLLGGWSIEATSQNSGERHRFEEAWLIGGMFLDALNEIVIKVYELTQYKGDIQDLVDDLLWGRLELVKIPRPVNSYVRKQKNFTVPVPRVVTFETFPASSDEIFYSETFLDMYSSIHRNSITTSGNIDCTEFRINESFSDRDVSVKFEPHQIFDLPTFCVLLGVLLKAQRPDQKKGVLRIHEETTSVYVSAFQHHTLYEVFITSKIAGIGTDQDHPYRTRWFVEARRAGDVKSGSAGITAPQVSGRWLICPFKEEG